MPTAIAADEKEKKRQQEAKRLGVRMLPYRVILAHRKPEEVVREDVEGVLKRELGADVTLFEHEVERPNDAFYEASWGGDDVRYTPLSIVRLWYYGPKE
jgi:hypothetical protein